MPVPSFPSFARPVDMSRKLTRLLADRIDHGLDARKRLITALDLLTRGRRFPSIGMAGLLRWPH